MSEYNGNHGQRTVFTSTTHGPTITTTTHTASGQTSTITTTNALNNATLTTTPNTTTVSHPNVTTYHQFQAPQAPSARPETQSYRPSIRIRRQGTDRSTQTVAAQPVADQDWYGNRRRSTPEPQRPDPALIRQDDLAIRRQATAVPPLQTLNEEDPTVIAPYVRAPAVQSTTAATRPPLRRKASSFGSLRSRVRNGPEYDSRMVDVLDVIDPEVSTLTTLNNVQNSLFIPNLGSFYRRQPTYDLTQASPNTDDDIGPIELEAPQSDGAEKEKLNTKQERPTTLDRQATISSVLTGISESHNYAVLPHGASLPGWTAEEKAALNDHVRHLLHSRRAKFKRSMRGFGRYVRKPVGFLVSLYAFLITFWGAAWVLFLIGWIGVGDRQAYFIEICDQILVALFCVVGIGFAPFRAIDTYHMIFVAHYAHLTWKLRRKRGLPALRDRNELPMRPNTHAWESNEEGWQQEVEGEESVLTSTQQRKLEHHQAKLAKSHTFYKPHETTTHRAFSIRLLITIVVLLDCHSLFQMALGATTWGIYYKHRPKALTAVILCCSISSNISAGITISRGDKRSRKKLVVEQMFRQGVTEDALKELREKRGLVAKGVGENDT